MSINFELENGTSKLISIDNNFTIIVEKENDAYKIKVADTCVLENLVDSSKTICVVDYVNKKE